MAHTHRKDSKKTENYQKPLLVIAAVLRTGQRRLQDIVYERRFRLAGHVLRMAPERPAHCAIYRTR